MFVFPFLYSIQFNTKIKYDFNEEKNAFLNFKCMYGEYVLKNLCFGCMMTIKYVKRLHIFVFRNFYCLYMYEFSRKYFAIEYFGIFVFLKSSFVTQSKWQNLNIIFSNLKFIHNEMRLQQNINHRVFVKNIKKNICNRCY